MKVSIDKDRCGMCASCVAICPEVFEMKDDGSIDVKDEYKGVDITDENIVSKIKDAVSGCPSSAIIVEE